MLAARSCRLPSTHSLLPAPCHVCLAPSPQEESYKARLAALKREEEAARQELQRLEAEKTAHIQ